MSWSICRGGSRSAATSKMELLVIIVNGFQPLTFITKCSILDVASVLDPPLIWKIEVHLQLLFFVNCQTTIAFRDICSHISITCESATRWIPLSHFICASATLWKMWVRIVGPHLGFPFLVGESHFSLCNYSFQSYQNPVNSGGWHFCRP